MQEDLNRVNDSERVKNYLDLAKEFQEQKLFQKAEDTLLLGLKKLPSHPILLTKLANFYNDTDRSDKALRTLNKLIKNQQDFKFPYYLRAGIYEDRQKPLKAISDYQKALTRAEKDTTVLSKLIPLLIENKKASKALNLIEEYKKLLNDPLFYSEIEAEAFVKLGKNAEAFNKMRSILIKEPENRKLLRKYLKLSIQTSKKSPVELYDMLSNAVPQLKEINKEELTDLEVDYLIHHQKYTKAQQEIKQMIQKFPDRYYWHRKYIFLQNKIGKLDSVINELEILILYNPQDVGIRQIYEEYIFQNNLIGRWKSVIKKVKNTSYYDHNLNHHIREICEQYNLLPKTPLDFNKFIENIEALNFDKLNLENITYKKLPLYVLRTFIMQICLEDKIPCPDELWKIINEEGKLEHQEIPFQLEDLNFAYPIWLFGLQFLFLFKTFTSYDCSFKPVLFQKKLIALILEMNNQEIQLDIHHLLKDNPKNLKPLVQVNRKWRLRWPKDISPENTINGIPLYSDSQFLEIFGKLKSNVEK
jgi:tetratricopeptide (TPR) repeat protein